jgi:RimJ/RimL family protein N-acetyltransferase
MEYLHHANTPEDFENYLTLKSDPAAVLWSGFKSAPDRERLRAHFERVINNQDVFIYYLFSEGSDKVIGYGQLDRENDTDVHYAGTSVMTDFQGKGYSKLLSSLLLDKARELGFKNIFAWISEHNIPSIKSYEANGFVKSETNKMVKLEALEREDKFYLYERAL